MKEQKRQKAIKECRKNRKGVQIETDKFRNKLSQGAGLLNQMIILNKAGDKI